MTELARDQFNRISQKLASAHSRDAAVDIVRSAWFAGELGALSDTQREQLRDVIRELGDDA